MVEAHPVLQIADRVLDLGVTAMVGFEDERLPLAVGDERMKVVEGEEGELGPGVGRTRRTMSRTGAASFWSANGVYVVSATSAPPVIQYGMGAQASSGIASINRRTLRCWRIVIE
jgi:hypothetical protein